MIAIKEIQEALGTTTSINEGSKAIRLWKTEIEQMQARIQGFEVEAEYVRVLGILRSEDLDGFSDDTLRGLFVDDSVFFFSRKAMGEVIRVA